MSDIPQKIGIIAGSGDLPKQLITACKEDDRPYFIIALQSITEEDTVKDSPHLWVPIGKVGKIIRTLRKENVSHIIMAGKVTRPNLGALDVDVGGVKLLFKLQQLKNRGDDTLLTTIITYLEQQGFGVIGSEDILSNLLIDHGPIGAITPDDIAQGDIQLAAKAAKTLGALDIGQGAIAQRGLILGVEGQEGTDRLIARCGELQSEGEGGVLVKVKKPHQDSRVDLPSIGVQTVENIHAAGLRGIAVEAGSALVINREDVVTRADELGIFVTGIALADYIE